ncbi:hypothetical protein HNR60_002570 [Rhodopseudomonas rhenobacensis]|uniref:Uncharacterized protein n=1 Tax=Rhodopseudomonas rhenobacensis TaxID=87461 RepID=A0A7W7Z4E6_9BRAD|nr:hypothetical protein [Rhodopseudomonas rhenobacensis]MBB5047813.1 hypothetical protein [Rhodopseudomonas rhenobacensis]
MRRNSLHGENVLDRPATGFRLRLASLTALVAVGMVLAPAIGFVMLLVD